MNSQLVLQWCEPNLPDFDQLIGIEDSLVAVIGHYGEVDGHDVERRSAISSSRPTSR